MVLTVVAAVVVGFVGLGRLLTGASDGQSASDQAATAGQPRETPGQGASDGADAAPDDSATSSPGTSPGAKPKKARKSRKPPPATPDGPCAEEDVVVTPSVKRAVGGSPIVIRLDLTTIESDACWWKVSPETLTMRISSGDDEVWSSRQCPAALPERTVAVRQDRRQRIRVRWSARRSDEECSRLTEWALPGYYYVQAAAFAGEPREEQFEVTKPKRPVITRTTEPDPEPDAEKKRRRGGG